MEHPGWATLEFSADSIIFAGYDAQYIYIRGDTMYYLKIVLADGVIRCQNLKIASGVF